MLSFFSQSFAATLTWDANGATALRTDGLGVWLNANQWWNGSSNVTWTSGDDAIFGNGGAGGAVTLASPTTVGSITFNSFTGTYTLGTAGQTITLNNGITMNAGAGAVTIVSPITLGGAQSWINNAGTTLTVSGAVTNGGNLLTIGGNSPVGLASPTAASGITISGAIGGTGGLTKNGISVLTLTGNNGYTGTTTLNEGTLVISGASGAINSTDAIALNGGNLYLVNTTQVNRVADGAAITSTGGTITYDNTAGANLNYTETIGAVTLSSGQLNAVLAKNQNNATNNSQTLTLGGLSQSGTSAVTFSALTTGPQASGGDNMIVVSGAGTTTAGQIIGPWATTGTSAAVQTDYAVYNANYVTAAAIGGTTEGSWTGGATGNYTSTSTANTLTGSRTMNSWRYNAAAGALTLGANNFDTNGILNGGSGLLTISGTGAVRQQGTSAANLYVTTGSNAITISAPIQDNTGALTLVKSGTGGTLTLSGSNTYTGGTVLNAGTLAANSTAALPGYNVAGKVVFNGGTLQLPSAWAMADINTLVSNATKTAGALALDTTSGTQTQTAAWNLGALGLTKVGTGTLVLNQANTYTGLTTVSAGTLQLSHANALGSSELNLNGAATVLLDTTVNLTTLSFDALGSTVTGGTLAFGAGGSIQGRNNTGSSSPAATISSAITGSPSVLIAQNANGPQWTFAPTSGSQTLGKVTLAYSAGSDKATMVFAGTTTGNTVTEIMDLGGYSSVNQTSGTWTYGNIVAGGVNLSGGNMILNGTVSASYWPSSNLTVSGGTLYFNHAAAANYVGFAGLVFTGGNLDNSSGTAITSSYNNPMRWNGNWTFLGSNGANSDLNLGTGAVTMNNALTGSPVVTIQNAATTLTVGGAIGDGTGVVGLTKAGAGTLRLTGASTFDGPTLVSAGTLALGNNSALQNSALNTTLGSGVVTFSVTAPIIGGLNGSVDLATKFTTGYSSVTTLTLNPQAGITASYSGAIANGAMNLTKTGLGTQILSGTNSYSGTTTVTAGTLVANSTSALPGYNSAGKVVFNGGTLQLTLDGTGWTTGNVDTLLANATKTSGTLGLDIASGTQTQSGSYNMGAVGLTKIGAGTLGLNLANTYTGATTITGGTVLLDGASGAIASSSGITLGSTSGTTGNLTLDNSSANNTDRVGSVAMGFNNGTLNFIGNASSASTETIGTVTAAVGHNQIALSGGDPSQVAILTSSAGAVTRTAGATMNILADGTSQQFKFTGAGAVINKGVFSGATAATANEFAYYPGSGAALRAPIYGTDANFAAETSSALTSAQHNKLNGSIASQAAVSIYSLNMPGNSSLTALTGNLTFSNGVDQGAIIKSGGGAAQIGTAGNAFDIVGQTSGELVVNTVDTGDNLALNVGITATTTALTKTGAGTLTLTSNRDYLNTGATTVNAGTLVLNSQNTDGFKSTAITINNGGTLKLGAANKIVNTATNTVNAGGTFDLAGFSDSIASISGSGNVANTGGAATLALLGGSANRFSGVISGNTSLYLNNNNASVTVDLTLSGQNTYSGTTTIGGGGWGAGILRLGANNAVPSGSTIYVGVIGGTSDGAIFDLAGFDQTAGPIYMAAGNTSSSYARIVNYGGTSKLTLTGGASALTTTPRGASADVLFDIAVTTVDLNNATQTFTIGRVNNNGVYDLRVSSVITNGSLTKAGTGLLLLSGANTYTGITTVSGGVLNVSTLANGGSNSNLGASSNAAGNLILNGGTLRYSGAAVSTDRLFSLQTSSTLDASGAGAVNFTNAGSIGFNGGTAAKTLTLTGSNTGDNTIAAIIGDNTGATAITKTGVGTWVLAGTNTYSGINTITAGVLGVSTLANGGSNSSLGKSSNAAANLVFGAPTSTLRYTGSSDVTTDRSFTMSSGVGGGATLESSGIGSLSFNNTVALAYGTTNQTRILTLGGTNTGANTFGKVLANNGSGASSLTKTGVGSWVLNQANTYSGTTTVQAGALVAGANAPLSANGAFGNAASALVLGNASTLAGDAPSLFINGAFTIARAITVGTGAATAYNATLGGSNTSGTSIFSGGITLTDTGSYTTTLQAATGGTVDFQGAWTNNGNKAIAIGSSGNTGTVKLTSAISTSGGVSVNFGTLLLGSSDRLSNTTPVTVAGGTLDLADLTDTVASFSMSSGSLNGSGTLTAATYGLTGGTVNAKLGAGAVTVNGNVTFSAADRLNASSSLLLQNGTLTLAGNQSVASYEQTGGTLAGAFSINSASNYNLQAGTLSANLGGSSGLNKTGVGTTILTGTNTYTGATNIDAGILQLDGSTGASSTANIGTAGMLTGTGTINGNATLTGGGIINKSSGTIAGTLGVTGGNWNGNGAVTGLITSSSGTFTIGNGANLTASSGVSATGGAMVVNGTLTGTLNVDSSATISGTGTITGNTTISGIHSPGNSPGIQNYSNNLSYTAGSSVTWELAADTLSGRGTDFDGINVGGILDFTGATAINLVFNSAGSTVDWADTIWETSRTGTSGWLIYDVAGSTTNFSNLTVNTTDWLDGNGVLFSTLNPGNTFSLFQDGNDIYLNYNVIPEPKAALLGGLGLLLLLRRRREK